jgi:hypothetical protein
MRLFALLALFAAGCLDDVVPGHPEPPDMRAPRPDMVAPGQMGANESPDMAAPGFSLRINVDGPAWTGVTLPGEWAADPGVPGGVCGDNIGGGNTGEINGTEDDPLYQGEVYGNPVTCAVGGGTIPPGTYTVTLHFAEIYWGPGCPGGGDGLGARVFDIALEGNTVLQNFDIFSEGGCAASTTDLTGKPVAKSFTVAINDGTLDISMPATVDNGKISAIEITSN